MRNNCHESEYRDFFRYVKDKRVQGIESYSSHHSQQQNELFTQLAQGMGLFSTGGSDFHGETKPQIQLGVFGEAVEIDLSSVLKMMT